MRHRIVSIRRHHRARRRWAGYRGEPLQESGARLHFVVSLGAGIAAAAALGKVLGAPGLAVGLLPPVALPRLLRRAARRDRRLSRMADEQRQLPGALDLLAACLAAGAPVAAAIVTTGRAVRGPLGSRLETIAAALGSAVPEDVAWQPAFADDAAPSLGWVAHGVLRTSRSGSPLAPWLSAIAAQVREDTRLEGMRRAERAGVLAVLPLGLCALPAYLLLGVVPAVAGLLHTLR